MVVRKRGVQLGTTWVCPGDAVTVFGVPGYDFGRFQGLLPSGKLAIKVSLGAYRQTVLSLERGQVRPKGAA
jgi:hypothetical protein